MLAGSVGGQDLERFVEVLVVGGSAGRLVHMDSVEGNYLHNGQL